MKKKTGNPAAQNDRFPTGNPFSPPRYAEQSPGTVRRRRLVTKTSVDDDDDESWPGKSGWCARVAAAPEIDKGV